MDKATLTCPECQAPTEKEVPQNRSDVKYTCEGCNTEIKTKEGVCCIYCSHSDKQCDMSVLKEFANESADSESAS